MKIRMIFLFILALSAALTAFDYSMLNLDHPSGLTAGEKLIAVRHRFYGDITDEPLENFFGMDAGANVGIAFRYALPYNLEAGIGYIRRSKEKSLGIAYKLYPGNVPLRTEFLITYFSYKDLSQDEENRSNFLYLLAMQNEPVWEKLTGTVNIGYDGYNERLITGFGLTLEVMDKFYFLGEYYPVLDRDENSDDKLQAYIGEEDAYAFGIKLDTYGHHFIFMISNSDDMGLRRTSLGTVENADLKFGFNIERRF